MKNKKQKKPTKVNNYANDFDSLNSELGSFNLEPPKHYRNNQNANEYVSFESNSFNQQERSSWSSNSRQKSNSKSKRQVQNYNEKKRTVQKKKRKRSKLYKQIVSSICICVAIIVIVVALSLTVFFRIDTIKISGNSIYTKQQITSVLPISTNKNLFLADLDGAEQKLEESLPYIYKAEIKRKLPSTIVVNITETPKAYSIKNKDKTFTIVDENFKILKENAKKKEKGSITITKAELKNVVVGKKATFKDEQVYNDLAEMTKVISNLKLDEITAIYSVNINNNYMIYDGRITFKLGTTENLENKVYSALAATEKLNESDPSAKGVMTATSDKQIYFTEK